MKHCYSTVFLCTLLAGVQPVFAQKLPKMPLLPNMARASKQISSSISRAALMDRIARLEAENIRLRLRNEQERAYQAQLFTKGRQAIFRAIPTLTKPTNSYTGTVFQVQHQSEQEIYGVISTHALKATPNEEGMLNQHFAALVELEDGSAVIPAEVVQAMPSSMGDIALVKFSPEDEQKFEPLELETEPKVLPAQAYAQGYACNLLATQTFPLTGTTSLGALTGKLPAANKGDRAGFCGSPVFNQAFQLTGIHVGSSYITQTGYVAPASLLRRAVQALHNPQLKPFVLRLNGTVLAELAADEFVSQVQLLDAQQNVLWTRNTTGKFSLTAVQRLLNEMPGVAFIRLTIGQTHWMESEQGPYLFNDVSSPRIVLVKAPLPDVAD